MNIWPLIPRSERILYKTVRKTLKPVSEKDIIKYLKKENVRFETIGKEVPQPGICRLLFRIQKD